MAQISLKWLLCVCIILLYTSEYICGILTGELNLLHCNQHFIPLAKDCKKNVSSQCIGVFQLFLRQSDARILYYSIYFFNMSGPIKLIFAVFPSVSLNYKFLSKFLISISLKLASVCTITTVINGQKR